MQVSKMYTPRIGQKYWGYVLTNDNQEAEKIVESLEKQTIPINLVFLRSENWSEELSPWEAPPAFGKTGFGGQGRKTLQWISEKAIPEAEGTRWKENRRFIGGYSLAGLFSLWAWYETELFSGVFSCSGSLWFPGWQEYMRRHQGKDQALVYLSLGDREEKIKNEIMKTVGDRTREQFRLLEKDPRVEHCKFEWNPGGHFEQPEERMIKAIQWIGEYERSIP